MPTYASCERDDGRDGEPLGGGSAEQALPGGMCAAPDCVHPYVDFGRGVARRYCSDSCATRTRVAALRRRRR